MTLMMGSGHSSSALPPACRVPACNHCANADQAPSSTHTVRQLPALCKKASPSPLQHWGLCMLLHTNKLNQVRAQPFLLFGLPP